MLGGRGLLETVLRDGTRGSGKLGVSLIDCGSEIPLVTHFSSDRL